MPFASFSDELGKLANPKRITHTSGSGGSYPFTKKDVSGMKGFLAKPEVRGRIRSRYSAAPRSGANKDLETAVRQAAKSPAPVPAVKAEAASGKAGLSKLFKMVGENKKLFGAVGGVAAGGALAAAMIKLMKKKSTPVAPTATETNG